MLKLHFEACGSRLKVTADVIGDLVRKVNTRLNNMNRISASIDYAMQRFGEVDQVCASRIKK